MRISGKDVAEELRIDLRKQIQNLKEKGITPKIAIITLGAEGAWEIYVKQKIKTAEELGIEAVLIHLDKANQEDLLRKIDEINNDPSYQGMIVQRPMPDIFDKRVVTNAIAPEKDIDGFRENSEFEVPVWLAAKKLLLESLKQLGINKPLGKLTLVVVGKGETAGGPIARGLAKMGADPTVVDSKTENPNQIFKGADIIVTCAGRNLINPENIKPGVVLIGVGTRGEDGKLKGDYDGKLIDQIAGSYTPTPGGVGPVNLTYLFSNLIDAANKSV